MSVAVVLFTADLRLHDHPPLRAALRAADEVVPLFVLDPGIHAAGFDAPNRRAFLADCLHDLDASLRRRAGRLVVRSGPVVRVVREVVAECGAGEVHLAAGVTAYAHHREERLREGLGGSGVALHAHETVTTVVAPGAVTPAGSDHFAVFTPYFRRWARESLREPFGAPRTVRVPDGVRGGPLPDRAEVPGTSPGLPDGGETAGRDRFSLWSRAGMSAYEDRHDDLAGDATSRLSPYLHFGALSAVELVHRARRRGGPGAEAFVRQLCWRDFHHQVLAARPKASAEDYRTRHDHWRGEKDAAADISAWREGRTGYPVVDAAMRQLRHEGWMHNRARLLVASFLTKTLYVDWRIGARHFLDLLVDGDIVNNQLNWQWVAGTGTDTRPHRVLNPVVQGRRFDPDGAYVHRWVPELRDVDGKRVHEPWRLPEDQRAALDYPAPLIDLADGLDRFRHARGRD
ncbi:Deoxyribodipyrimidine photo-lyase [Streptomyces ambofaciens ATCC 23877]|uniref:Deoxyribodipyrimidine photo-lyase n=1 Tax=Streptomyces ambofaciens (strain ATCC 23877 / 3486 / DSM 40053 / JCM 4204 / NBRC 12836 / NRRL B-2516) TaxID=278992 RepID=A0ACL5_STRA7|nr:deoxyribodipyrimidine photo-lyase [Streptomyces ambofaciens]AKZ60125.1 Deoxyribodipyrimidine photo-lyase [Streptomyces ambofaciens ATCC 23877]CAJ88219.1 putative deoxyribodipyrimidine photolyase [Streptomyces ambofaciens ATCC 23877]